jgi:DNA-binding YbaB/EbfC family protein
MQQQNLPKMLKGIAEMQKRAQAIQTEIAQMHFEGTAANSLVKATINGEGKLLKVVIDPTVLSEDAETVGDLVIVATNNAHDAKEVEAKKKLATLGAGLLPLGMKIPGLG